MRLVAGFLLFLFLASMIACTNAVPQTDISAGSQYSKLKLTGTISSSSGVMIGSTYKVNYRVGAAVSSDPMLGGQFNLQLRGVK